jgi:hypothetical protein
MPAIARAAGLRATLRHGAYHLETAR